jgi:dTDP-4-amino-4,6-dideoxygalactose transaminase
VFSFHPVKHIACGEGGMVTTNSKELYDHIKLLRTHGISKLNMKENHGGWYYEMHELGLNYRLTDIQAALGITQLAKNNFGVRKRNEIANEYINAFKGKIKYQEYISNYYNAYHLFVIEIINREELYNYLRSNGVFAQVHYIPLHTLPYYEKYGFKNSDLKNAESYYSKCISLPMFPTLKAEEQRYIIKCILEFIR